MPSYQVLTLQALSLTHLPLYSWNGFLRKLPVCLFPLLSALRSGFVLNARSPRRWSCLLWISRYPIRSDSKQYLHLPSRLTLHRYHPTYFYFALKGLSFLPDSLTALQALHNRFLRSAHWSRCTLFHNFPLFQAVRRDFRSAVQHPFSSFPHGAAFPLWSALTVRSSVYPSGNGSLKVLFSSPPSPDTAHLSALTLRSPASWLRSCGTFCHRASRPPACPRYGYPAPCRYILLQSPYLYHLS